MNNASEIFLPRYARTLLKYSGGVLDRRYLVVKNTERNRWEFPGGKVEPGERDLDTAVRELREEVSVRTKDIARLRHLAQRQFPIDGVEWIGNYFTAEIIDPGRAVIAEPEKFSELRWVTLRELAYLPQIPWGTYLIANLETMDYL